MAGLAIRRRMERREAVVVVKQRAEPVRPRIARAVLVPLHDAGYVGDRRAGEPAHGARKVAFSVFSSVIR